MLDFSIAYFTKYVVMMAKKTVAMMRNETDKQTNFFCMNADGLFKKDSHL